MLTPITPPPITTTSARAGSGSVEVTSGTTCSDADDSALTSPSGSTRPACHAGATRSQPTGYGSDPRSGGEVGGGLGLDQALALVAEKTSAIDRIDNSLTTSPLELFALAAHLCHACARGP